MLDDLTPLVVFVGDEIAHIEERLSAEFGLSGTQPCSIMLSALCERLGLQIGVFLNASNCRDEFLAVSITCALHSTRVAQEYLDETYTGPDIKRMVN